MTGKKNTPGPALTQSPFLIALRGQFFDTNDDPTWPTSSSPNGRTDQAKKQMSEALRAMIGAVVKRKIPSGRAKKHSALERVHAAAKATDWAKASGSAPTFSGNAETFRYFEVGCAIDIMMEAFRRSGGGGPGDPWPNGGGGKH